TKGVAMRISQSKKYCGGQPEQLTLFVRPFGNVMGAHQLLDTRSAEDTDPAKTAAENHSQT
ncbi:Hypothetical predicted protein, partial [Pelobates cultripes]